MEYNPNTKVNDKYNSLSASSSINNAKIEALKHNYLQNETIEDVMKDLEYKVNPKSSEEGLDKLLTVIKTNNTSIILNPLRDGAKEFESRVGRPMTYSELRSMWG